MGGQDEEFFCMEKIGNDEINIIYGDNFSIRLESHSTKTKWWMRRRQDERRERERERGKKQKWRQRKSETRTKKKRTRYITQQCCNG